MLFATTRHAYARLERGEVSVGVVCLGAGQSAGELHPFTGLMSGFIRSLVRELPAAACCQVNTREIDLAAALEYLDDELESAERAVPPEIYRAGNQRFIQRLMELDHVAGSGRLLTADSVVVATGGARGVTAVLVESLRREYGCTVALIGRTDPAACPADLRAMDDDAFDQFEPEFYRRELTREPGRRLPALKRVWSDYRAAREVATTLQVLDQLPGRSLYLRADINDADDVDRAIARVKQQFGGVDFILHGAGVQTSKSLARKRLEEFRAVVAPKLCGLGHLVRACRRHNDAARIAMHFVTSTFSFGGNPGQEDYGAANMALDRLAQYLAAPGDLNVSSLGWIGWFDIGMARGSEYVSLAILRRLRGITPDEGDACFSRYAAGRALAPSTYVMSELEAKDFGLTIVDQDGVDHAPAQSARLEQSWILTCDTYPFLRDHLVNGTPTLPGAYGLDLAARLAAALRPTLKVARLDKTSVERFVKVPEGRPFILRGVAEALEDRPDRSRVRVRLMSDFVHTSGRVLQADLVHLTTEITLTPENRTSEKPPAPVVIEQGWRLGDPYLHENSPVRLSGPFRSLHDIRVSETHATAIVRQAGAAGSSAAGWHIPVVLLDAVWRLSAMRRESNGSVLVAVPLTCEQIEIRNAAGEQGLEGGDCVVSASAARVRDNRVHVDWVEVRDAAGRSVISLKGVVGALFGHIRVDVEPLRSVRIVVDEPSVRPAAPRSSSQAARPLDGKIALVTGSGRGIGKVIADTLADLGSFVVVNSFHSPDEGEQTTADIVARGGRAIHVRGSVAREEQLARIFAEIDARAGGLDFFVSNASAGVFAPLSQITSELWERSFRTNVVAFHQASLLAAERMRPRGGGRIVALSSIGARYCFEYFGGLGPIKAALEALVSYLAVELAPDNVEVSAVAAGAVDGALLSQYPNRPRWENLAPRRTLNTEAEVADAVLFLLTGNGLNGSTVVVDAASGLRTCEPTVVAAGRLAGSSE